VRTASGGCLTEINVMLLVPGCVSFSEGLHVVI